MRIVSLSAVLAGETPGARFVVAKGHEWIVDVLVHVGHEASVVEVLAEGQALVVADSGMERLAVICDRLLGPGGCPWDQKQTHQSLKRYLLEEAYELFDAIDEESSSAIREELGDVLLQPVLHAAMRKRDGDFSIQDVAHGIADKLVRRHPHVFGDVQANDAETVIRNWDAIKKSEKAETRKSSLEGLSLAMPALSLAQEVSVRAARQGFEWPDVEGVFLKLDEELAELRQAMASRSASEVADELGDVLFTVVNLARWLEVDAEAALRAMVRRFKARFQRVEELLGSDLSGRSALEWESAWQTAKLELSS